MTQVADHFPQFLMIVKKVVLSIKNLSYYQRDHSKFDQERFLADFQSLNFDYLNENHSDVNTKFNRFLANLDELVKKHAPLKKLTKNILNCGTNHG